MRIFRTTIEEFEIHPSARKHGIADEDIEHAVEHAMRIESQEDSLRLYLGPGCDAQLLEVVTMIQGGGRELAIHAMDMRPRYIDFLPGE